MKHNRLNILFVLTVLTLGLHAQTNEQRNMFRVGDELIKQQVTSASVKTGLGVLADLRDIQIQKVKHHAVYLQIGNDSIGVIENGTMTRFKKDGNNLLMNGTESQLQRMDYTLPEVWLQFPMALHDSLGGLFEGRGHYGERMFIRAAGCYKTVADAIGMMLMPDGDTIRHVLRLRTERLTATASQPLDSMMAVYDCFDSIPAIGTDSICHLLESDKGLLHTVYYRYYAPGYRYPVLETTDIEGASNVNSPHYAVAVFTSLEEQEKLAADMENEIVRQQIKDNPLLVVNENINNGLNDVQRFQYTISFNPSAQRITMSYIMNGNVNSLSVSLLLCNQQGIVFRKTEQLACEKSELTLDCGGLPRGQYVLYIQAGEEKYAEKFNLGN